MQQKVIHNCNFILWITNWLRGLRGIWATPILVTDQITKMENAMTPRNPVPKILRPVSGTPERWVRKINGKQFVQPWRSNYTEVLDDNQWDFYYDMRENGPTK